MVVARAGIGYGRSIRCTSSGCSMAKSVCEKVRMRRVKFKRFGLAAMTLACASSSALAFEATTAVWDRFTLDVGQTSGISLRGYRLPQFAPNLTPMVGLNYENAQTASAVRGAWIEAARYGAFSAGPVVSVDRALSLATRTSPSAADQSDAIRYGGFLAYTDGRQEIGRLSLATGRSGGIDIRASRSFKLNDNVTLDIGPTFSLGSFERFGYDQIARTIGNPATRFSPDRAQLGAFGLATAVETRINDRTVARMFADYARVEAQRGQTGIGQLQARDRVDLGFSLTTRIGQ